MSQSQPRDEIDLFVDKLLAHPEKAEAVKLRLQDRFGDSVANGDMRAALRLMTLCGDAEGLWDNSLA